MGDGGCSIKINKILQENSQLTNSQPGSLISGWRDLSSEIKLSPPKAAGSQCVLTAGRTQHLLGEGQAGQPWHGSSLAECVALGDARRVSSSGSPYVTSAPQPQPLPWAPRRTPSQGWEARLPAHSPGGQHATAFPRHALGDTALRLPPRGHQGHEGRVARHTQACFPVCPFFLDRLKESQSQTGKPRRKKCPLLSSI